MSQGKTKWISKSAHSPQRKKRQNKACLQKRLKLDGDQAAILLQNYQAQADSQDEDDVFSVLTLSEHSIRSSATNRDADLEVEDDSFFQPVSQLTGQDDQSIAHFENAQYIMHHPQDSIKMYSPPSASYNLSCPHETHLDLCSSSPLSPSEFQHLSQLPFDLFSEIDPFLRQFTTTVPIQIDFEAVNSKETTQNNSNVIVRQRKISYDEEVEKSQQYFEILNANYRVKMNIQDGQSITSVQRTVKFSKCISFKSFDVEEEVAILVSKEQESDWLNEEEKGGEVQWECNFQETGCFGEQQLKSAEEASWEGDY